MDPLKDQTASQDSLCLTITGIYDTPESARRLKAKLEQYNAEGIAYELRIWRADILDLAESEAEARNDVIESDLLLVAFKGKGEGIVSRGLIDLLDGWLHLNRRPHTFMFVIPEDVEDAESTVNRLRQIAEHNHLPFLCPRHAATD